MTDVKQVRVTFDCADPRVCHRFAGTSGSTGTARARRLHLLPANEMDGACLVMQDIEGNELCLD